MAEGQLLFQGVLWRAGMSQRQAAEYALRNFAREMGIDLTPAPRQPDTPKPLTRLIVPPLDC